MIIKQIVKTCSVCPAQWEGLLEDNRYVYIRYRGGRFTIGIGDTIDEAVMNDFYYEEYGDAFDGDMSDVIMIEKALAAGFTFELTQPFLTKYLVIRTCSDCPYLSPGSINSLHYGLCKLSQGNRQIPWGDTIPFWCELPDLYV